MTTIVKVLRPVKIEVKPGYKVRYLWKGEPYISWNETNKRIIRTVETEKHSYVVWNDGTWHPMSAYGREWEAHISID